MTSLDDFARSQLAKLDAAGLRRTLVTTETSVAGKITRNGRTMKDFSSNDYLGLSQHPDVTKAAIRAIEQYGTGAGSSRLVTGNHPLFEKLEETLAQMKGTEAAMVFSSGYMANIGVIPALVGRNDVIFADELSHSCILGGAKLSNATVHRFRHNEMAHLAELLATQRGGHVNALIVTETVFSMDGDRAPLAELSTLSKLHKAWLMTDDAHGLGLPAGKKTGIEVPLQMGTLSKAAGSLGGYLCASRSVIELLHNRARSFVYTTGLSPADAAAALKSLRIMQVYPPLLRRPIARAKIFTDALGLPPPQSAIVPVIIGEAKKAVELSQRLERDGFFVAAIRPPTVPEGTARLRVTFSADHQRRDILQLARRIVYHKQCLAIS